MKERVLPQKANLLTPYLVAPHPHFPGLQASGGSAYTQDKTPRFLVPLRKFLRLRPETMARLPREVGTRPARAAGEEEGGGHCHAFPTGQCYLYPAPGPALPKGPATLSLKTAHPPPQPPTTQLG